LSKDACKIGKAAYWPTAWSIAIVEDVPEAQKSAWKTFTRFSLKGPQACTVRSGLATGCPERGCHLQRLPREHRLAPPMAGNWWTIACGCPSTRHRKRMFAIVSCSGNPSQAEKIHTQRHGFERAKASSQRIHIFCHLLKRVIVSCHTAHGTVPAAVFAKIEKLPILKRIHVAGHNVNLIGSSSKRESPPRNNRGCEAGVYRGTNFPNPPFTACQETSLQYNLSFPCHARSDPKAALHYVSRAPIKKAPAYQGYPDGPEPKN
jgi:hypothetical protein